MLFQLNLSGDSASLEKKAKLRRKAFFYLSDDVKINLKFQMHISAVLFFCDNRACKFGGFGLVFFFSPVEFHLHFSCFIIDYNICHFITPGNDYLCELHCSNRCLLRAAWHLHTVDVRYLFAVWVCNAVQACNTSVENTQACQPFRMFLLYFKALWMKKKNWSIIVLNTGYVV